MWKKNGGKITTNKTTVKESIARLLACKLEHDSKLRISQ